MPEIEETEEDSYTQKSVKNLSKIEALFFSVKFDKVRESLCPTSGIYGDRSPPLPRFGFRNSNRRKAKLYGIEKLL